MSLKTKAKANIKNKAKKIVLKVLKPFLPFIIIIVGLFFAICSIIDAVFVQEVQTDDTSMPKEMLEIKKLCITRSEYLNTCHNFKDGKSTNNLLDESNRENDKLIQWSHLYAILAFHNMSDNKKIDEDLLNQVSAQFKSTFKYETSKIKIETTTKDEEGNETTSTKEETHYILVESDSIIGHYKYNYEERIDENGNSKTTKKVFVGEELIGEKYERLKKYLKDKLHIKESDIEANAEIVIQASTGYYEGRENTGWLQKNPSADTIITDGTKLAPKGMFTWPIPGHTKISSHFRNENTPNNWSL